MYEWESGKSILFFEMVTTSEAVLGKYRLLRKLEPRFNREGILLQRDILTVFKHREFSHI